MTANDCLWLPEVTRGTYPTINGQVMYKFGVEPLDLSFPLKIPFERQINTVSSTGSRTATFTAGPSFPENIPVSYLPTNGLPEFHMLGDSSSAAGVHTLTALAVTTLKPSITVYRQGQAATEKRKAAGLVSKSLRVHHKIGDPLTTQEVYDGMTDAVTTDTPSTSPIFPTNIESIFDSKHTFTINGAAYEYEEIDWNWIEVLNSYGNNAGKRRGIIDNAPIILTMVVNLKGDCTALRTLFDAGTGPTVVWKVIKSTAPTHYKQYSLAMYIASMSDNFRLDDGTDRTVLTAVGSGTTVTTLDGVADAFYGD